MKLGINNNVNRESHKASLKHMAGGPSKINPPNSHPSNPIHKKATEAQGLAVKKKPPTQTKATDTPTTGTTTTSTKADSDDAHHVNKALVACLHDASHQSLPLLMLLLYLWFAYLLLLFL